MNTEATNPGETTMTDGVSKDRAKEILQEVRNRLGRTYKSAIRHAWMTGNYCGMREWAQELQQMRNQLGPAWLASVKV